MLYSLFVHAQQLLRTVVGICSLNLLNYIHAGTQAANDNNGTKTHTCVPPAVQHLMGTWRKTRVKTCANWPRETEIEGARERKMWDKIIMYKKEIRHNNKVKTIQNYCI